MDEQLKGAVAQILERAAAGIDSSVGFMQAEMPDVIEQVLMWHAVKSVAVFMLGLLWVVAYSLAVSAAYKSRPADGGDNLFWDNKWPHKDNEFNPGWIVAFALIGAFTLIPSVLMIANVMTTIQIWIAPKAWLMEYAAGLVG
jgi:hypothetical protein